VLSDANTKSLKKQMR